MTWKGVTPSWGWTEVELDFGDVPVSDAVFHIVNANVGPRADTKIAITPSGAAPTGLTSDEWQADPINFAAVADVADASGLTIYACAGRSVVKGKRKVLYQVT